MIEFARRGMRGELSALWQAAFHDPARIPRHFLNSGVSPRDCAVYRVGGRVVSAVYLLPAQILAGERRLQAQYVFAAATLPEYRSRGYMSSLLAFAALTGARRGDCFSAVVPSGEDLFDFYAKLGYADFFTVRMLSVPAARMRRAAEGARYAGRVLARPGELNALRGACLRGCGGSLLWSNRMFYAACGMSGVYGDRLVCARGGGGLGYALCRREGDACLVLELMADEAALPALAAALLREMPAGRYRLRLPAGCGPFPGEGETARFGMIKPLGGALPGDAQPHFPYLGLAMD